MNANRFKPVFIIITIMVLYVPSSFAQSFDWVKQAGGNSFDMGNDIVKDAAGNLFVTGSFGSGTATFGTINLTGSGTENIFVAKYDAVNGNCLWAVKGDGFIYPTSIALAANGEIYITGYLNATNTFGPIIVSASGIYDVFVAKLDSSGTWMWVTTAGGAGAGNQDYGNSIVADVTGCNIIGTFMSTVNFGGTSLTSAGMDDIFISRIDSSGAWQWTQQFGSAGNDDGNGITHDPAGNVYCTGGFSGAVGFGLTTLNSGSFEDIFVCKLDNSGAVMWAVEAGGSTPDFGNAIQRDNNGNLYVTGWYSTTAFFGTSNVTTTGANEVFVARCDTVGQWEWVSSGGTGGIDIPYDITVDDNHNSYITGYVNAGYPVTFGAFTISLTSAFADVFIAKCDSAGIWQWLTVNGAGGDDVGYGITNDNCSVYVSGFFKNTVSFGSTTLTAPGSNSDAFIARFIDPASGCGAPAAIFQSSDTTNCGKTCIDFTDLSTNNPTSWQWLFPGADSTSSLLQNPSNICYNAYGSFDVTLIACNAAGCDTLLLPAFINIYPDPVQPLVSMSNDTLICLTSAPAYQWYFNALPIAGATDSFYVAVLTGDYYITITDTNGCEAASALIFYTGIDDPGMNPDFIISPNPAHDIVKINIPSTRSMILKIDLLDITGRQIKIIFEGKATVDEMILKLPLEGFAKGVYLLRVNQAVKYFVID